MKNSDERLNKSYKIHYTIRAIRWKVFSQTVKRL